MDGGTDRPDSLTMVVGIATVVVTLYFGRDVLVPLALAALLSLAFAPVVLWLQRWRMPRLPAVLAVVAMALLVIGGFGTVVTLQFADLARQIPGYEHNMLAKIEAVRAAPPKGGLVEQLARVGDDLHRALGRTTTADDDGRAPVPVVVHEGFSPIRLIENVVGPALQPITTIGIVVIFVIFILMQREDLRNRLVRLAGLADMGRTTIAIDDAVGRVSRYLLAQLGINSGFGALVGLGLWAIGLPSPLLWGMMAGVMRFVPYFGSIISASFPLLLSIAVAPGWTTPLLVFGLFLALELVVANFVEPLLYGSSTGLAPLSVLAGAIVWTSLWGPAGLLLATPLNVCLVVLGKHVPMLHFLTVILGDAPVLPDEARLYQRLLAADVEEAAQLCMEFAAGKPSPALHDGLLLPALMLAERDRRRGSLSSGRQRAVVETLAEALASLAEPAARTAGAGKVLCLPLHCELDRALAVVLADLLGRDGWQALIPPPPPAAGATLASPEHRDVERLCLCALGFNAHNARRLVGRVRQHFPDAQIFALTPAGEAPGLTVARTPSQAAALIAGRGVAAA